MKRLYQKRPLCFFIVCFTFCLAFVLWLSKLTAKEEINEYSVTVTLTGTLEEKKLKSDRQIYYLKDCTFSAESANNLKKKKQQNIERSVTGEGVVCYLDGQTDGKIGQKITVTGTLQNYPVVENEGQFDVKTYYQTLGYESMLLNAIVLEKSERYDFLGELLECYRGRVCDFYRAHMSSQDASVVSAMLLGEKDEMDAQIKSLYQKNGIAHILAISGLHISFLGIGIFSLLRKCFLPTWICAGLGITIILLYGKMIHGQSSVFRASIMFFLYILANHLSESYDQLTAMAVAAFLLLVQNPNMLLNAGFWLSFFAVLAIGAVYPALQEGFGEIPWIKGILKGFRGIGATLLGSFSIQLVTLPILLWFYYSIPLYSVFLNLFIIPLLSILLFFGIFSGIFKLWIALIPVGMILHFYEFMCNLVEKLPYCNLIVGKPLWWQVLLYYMILLLGISFINQKKKAVACVLLLCGMVLLFLPVHRKDAVDVLSVGQGDGICIRSKQGGCVLLDGGSSSKEKLYDYTLLPYLKCNGIRRIDAIFVSHSHEDHISGALELLEKGKQEGIEIGGLYLTELAMGNSRYEQLIKTAEQNQIPVFFIQKGQSFATKGISLTCLYPDIDTKAEEENDESMVLCLTLRSFHMLLTGDLTQKAESSVMEQMRKLGMKEIDCLKVAHHGARTSNGSLFLTYLSPKSAVISCGKNNHYGHPHEETIQRLIKMNCATFQTDSQGQIRLLVKKDGYQIRCYKNS